MPLRKVNVSTPECTQLGRYSTYRKEFVHPTGIQTLDYYLGGGLANKSCCLIEDCNFPSHLCRTFLRRFVRVGQENDEKVVIIGKCGSFTQALLNKDDAVTEDSAGNENGADHSSLKIAWRYEHLRKSPISGEDPAEEANTSLAEDVLKLNSFELGLCGIQDALKTLIANNKNKVLRIVFLEFGSTNFWPSYNCASYAAFFCFVKSLLSLPDRNVVGLCCVSQRGLMATSMLPKMRHLSDYHISIVSFDQLATDVADTSNVFSRDHLGFLNILKVPYVCNSCPQLLEDSKFGVKRRKQQLILERLHLPPDLSANRTDVNVLSSCISPPSPGHIVTDSASKEAW